MLGVAIGMMSSISAREPALSEQRRTQALLVFPALAASTLSTLVAGWLWLSSAVFLGVVFASVYARRYGSRATALGTIATFAYFDAEFFRAPVSAIPAIVGSVAIGVAIAFVVRFAVVRETPSQLIDSTLACVPLVIRKLVRELAGVCARPERGSRSLGVRRALLRLNEVALTLDEHLQNGGDSGRLPIRLAALDLELAAGQLARQVRASLGQKEDGAGRCQQLMQSLAQFERSLEPSHPPGLDRVAPGELRGVDCSALKLQFDRLMHALARVQELGAARDPRVPSAVPRAAPNGNQPNGNQRIAEPVAVEVNTAAQTPSSIAVSTRQAFQATLACALAILLGYRLSPDRWYWAVITAFVVFTQVQTVSDTLLRAWHRVLGTLIGVLAGSLLAHVLTGHRWLELGCVFFFIFLGFYLLRVSYAGMVFCITALLAVLYSLLGRSSAGLLELRVLETLVGAAAAVAAAALVLPTPALPRVRTQAAQLLLELEAYLKLALDSQREAIELLESGRKLEADLASLVLAARPLMNRLFVSGRRMAQFVDSLSTLVFVVRQRTNELRGALLVASQESASRASVNQQIQDISCKLRALSRRAETVSAGRARAVAHTLPLASAGGRVQRDRTSGTGEPSGSAGATSLDRLEQAIVDVDSAARAWQAS
ncbi:MAG TPA: FUSC family protein [Polyangiaceae bacterium]|nr:FUSC family protein [Polyangiaceae bacterium]